MPVSDRFVPSSMNVDEMQTGNGSASAADHAISVTGVGVCEAETIGAPVPSSNSGSTSGSP